MVKYFIIFKTFYPLLKHTLLYGNILLSFLFVFEFFVIGNFTNFLERKINY